MTPAMGRNAVSWTVPQSENAISRWAEGATGDSVAHPKLTNPIRPIRTPHTMLNLTSFRQTAGVSPDWLLGVTEAGGC